MSKNKGAINIITLGCSKNLVDSEQLASQIKNRGFEVAHNSNEDKFDIAILNTCGFINDAKQESIDLIFQLINLKSNGKLKKVIVFGCLSQRYMKELQKEIPEVDVFLGNYNVDDILKNINCDFDVNNRYKRLYDSAGHFAYLKIAEGCNRRCAFCAIPSIKGKYVSRPIDDILDEARQLASDGVKELILIAQDLSYYGVDIQRVSLLPELVQKLSEIEQIKWIRLQYLYPFLFPDKLIDIIANNPKVCKYIDIPLQHISNNVLRKMNRGGSKNETQKLLEKFRNKIPDVAIRTTILLGYPGETEEDFQELLKFVQDFKFDRLGAFKYSEEDGTIAQKNFKDSIPDKIKEERLEQLMEIQRNISYNSNFLKLGNVYRVLIDKEEPQNYIGRTEFDSVEVDNEVIIVKNGKDILEIGEFYDVKITDFNDYELFGVLI